MKTISVSTLKTQLNASLKRVRAGTRLTIVDRNIPIAEIVPIENKDTLIISEPSRSFSVPETEIRIAFDPTDHLFEDRSSR